MSALEDALRALDQKTWGAVEDAREALVVYGQGIFPMALDVYPQLRGYRARAALVYTAIKYAMVEPDAVTLADRALEDKSHHVIYRACMLLAVAGQDESLPGLARLQRHKREDVRDDALAAIRAIQQKNHNLFVQRNGSTQVTLNINGLIRPV